MIHTCCQYASHILGSRHDSHMTTPGCANAVSEAVCKWLTSAPKDFYTEGIIKLVSRWEKCVTIPGDYVEK